VYLHDTIAAISTASGVAAVAIVRVSGADAVQVAERVFRGRRPERWESHRLYPGRFVDPGGRVLDQGLGVLMRAPRSYTGEDVLELHGHGGVLLARRILGAALAAGARAAHPGEFTLRAFLNGKLDLAQAESVADLVAAPTDAAVDVALEHLAGALSRAVEGFRERAVAIAARLEVAIDFSEDDVGELDGSALAADAEALAGELRALAATHDRGRILREGFRVAIVGKPNVGKSSVLNRLLQTDRAIVTPVPGTTRDVIEEAIDIEGLAIVVVDTAGIRAGAEEVETIGIERTREQIRIADLVLVVLDNGRRWDGEDERVLSAMRHKNFILLINKDDLTQRLALPACATGVTSVRASALTGAGIEALRSAIVSAAGFTNRGDTLTITRERHRHVLDEAALALDRAGEALRIGHPPDVVAVDILGALHHLGEIVGRTSPEAVLDRIFSEFCIGK
jgi:tRNA modification GTPase